MPAAPSVWPVKPLVELACVGRRKAPRDQRAFDFVVLGAGRAVHVDVVDLVGAQAGACQRVVERAFGAQAFGMRRRHVVRVAGFAVAEQLRARRAPRSSSAKPAASPRLMPSRAASNGRHGSGDTSSSELKPNSTLPHSVSTPPTTAASTRPRRISRSAEANTLALDEQAVEMVSHGPSRPSACLHEHGERMRRVHPRAMRWSGGKAPSARAAV